MPCLNFDFGLVYDLLLRRLRGFFTPKCIARRTSRFTGVNVLFLEDTVPVVPYIPYWGGTIAFGRYVPW